MDTMIGVITYLIQLSAVASTGEYTLKCLPSGFKQAFLTFGLPVDENILWAAVVQLVVLGYFEMSTEGVFLFTAAGMQTANLDRIPTPEEIEKAARAFLSEEELFMIDYLHENGPTLPEILEQEWNSRFGGTPVIDDDPVDDDPVDDDLDNTQQN